MGKHLTISVVMAVYEGEKYLPDMLASLASQTRCIDELVVGDDSTSDRCQKIIEAFRRKAPFPIRYRRNKPSLGVDGNFAATIAHAQSELIFMADQDDIWLPEKIGAMAAILEENDNYDAVFCNSTVVDESLKPRKVTLWELRHFNRRKQLKMEKSSYDALEVFLQHIPSSGHNIAFRTSLKENILPLPQLRYCYDSWIALVAVTIGRFYALNEELTLYRVHDGNISTPDQRGLRKRWNEAKMAIKKGAAAWHTAILTALLDRFHLELSQRKIALIETKIAFSSARSAMDGRNFFARTFMVLRETLNGRYFRFGRGFLNIIQDLILR